VLAKTSTTSARLLAALLALGGCSDLDNCPDGQGELAPITSGKTDLPTLTYESSPWGRDLTAFPPNTNLRFVHDLGFAPFLVKTYVAFAQSGTADAGEGDVTENAGNQARIQCVDARQIVIENDTCEEDFYVRVIAMANGTESTELFCDDEER
jgi:hypothetical protein